jgi:hypothetical protein
MKKMTQEQFNEWIDKMADEFANSNYTHKLCKDRRTTVVISEHGNKFGKATCHKDDMFNGYVGIAIAFAKAIGQEVPTVVEKVKIDSLHHGDKFIYDDYSYIYIAKHPTIPERHITVLERSGVLYALRGSTLVEKA